MVLGLSRALGWDVLVASCSSCGPWEPSNAMTHSSRLDRLKLQASVCLRVTLQEQDSAAKVDTGALSNFFHSVRPDLVAEQFWPEASSKLTLGAFVAAELARSASCLWHQKFPMRRRYVFWSRGQGSVGSQLCRQHTSGQDIRPSSRTPPGKKRRRPRQPSPMATYNRDPD